MFAWIRSFVEGTVQPSLESFRDALPVPATLLDVVGTVTKRVVGSLDLPSGVALLMDPCSDGVVEVSGFVERRAMVIVEEFHDPVEELRNPISNTLLLRTIELVFDSDAPVDKTRKLGALEIESARIAAADRDDWKIHRQKVGPLRELRMNARFDPEGKVRFAIMEEFGVAWRAIDLHRMVYAATRPVDHNEYVAMQRVAWIAAGNEPPLDDVYPSFGLTHVTGSTFDRMNEFCGIGLLPIGEPEGPRAFVGLSGMGEGTYEVVGQFAEGRLIRVVIRFLKDAD